MNPSGKSPLQARKPQPVVTTPMKKVPRLGKRITRPLLSSTGGPDDKDALIDSLNERVNELEERLATLESVVQIEGGDVVISSTHSVLIQGSSTVEVSAGGSVKVSGGTYECNAGIAQFTGIAECDTLITNTVVAAVYTPGAGNLW